MKIWKVLILAVSMVMLAAGPVGAADTKQDQMIDFDGYTDEEMVVLLEQVQNEIVERGIEKSAVLEKGKYEGGKEIPAGSYVVRKEAATAGYGIIWLSAADDPEDKYPSKLYEFSGEGEEAAFYISVEEGDILNVPFQVTLTISSGVVFK